MPQIAKRFMVDTGGRAPKCYSCSELLGRYAWRYIGTHLSICEQCHGHTKRKNSRRLVDLEEVDLREAKPLSRRIEDLEERIALLEEEVRRVRRLREGE